MLDGVSSKDADVVQSVYILLVHDNNMIDIMLIIELWQRIFFYVYIVFTSIIVTSTIYRVDDFDEFISLIS